MARAGRIDCPVVDGNIIPYALANDGFASMAKSPPSSGGMTPAKWTLFAVLGLVALLIFCCVPAGLIGGYFLFKDQLFGDKAVAILPVNKVTRENFNKITDGMTPGQVEEILGRGQPVAGQQEMFEWRSGGITIRVGFVNGRVNRRSIVERN
jgi:hypothetical protein